MASQIILIIASLCLWHQTSAQTTVVSSADVGATPSAVDMSASIGATPALQSGDSMTSSTAGIPVLPPIFPPTSTTQAVQPAPTTNAVSGGGGGSSTVAPAASPAASAAASNTVNPSAIAPTSSAGSGTPATSIVAAWNAWVNQNCKSMCCGGLSSNKKYQENRTCSNANVMYCPSDAHGRNLTRDKDCPTCVNGDCSFSAPGNDAANAKPWTVLLFSVFMVALGFAFAH